ncbi:iron-containing alcohol dehydrogenase [Neoroseomonas oryzicola]|uniref:Iron-containing alcohol dehydrogenase n=1 Tax=Neoroseomonas oryzicola TaxID=535904 RepID=A0A9X9WK24_9PROT|nr:iron-containing alcohol dehydrogenase [Neoroseomonas oryzicola]MBR0660684.1 iron-containing alcohol dehydrogenase [Neoroseomonas oryzicola]NKE17511.1 iron-containing alcohol dehydrogenase [Neoroseomonas oryzicola]
MAAHLHQWPAQGRVHLGAALAEALPREVSEASRVVLVTTRSLAGGALVQSAKAAIGDRLAGTFAAMRAHSPVEDVVALAALVRDQEADLIVALGGGSVIDGSKVACLATWRGIGDAGSLIGAAASRGAAPGNWDGSAPAPRIVAIPTTLSAAEFAPHAGYTDIAAGTKYRALDPWMVPRAVILDPAATLETPAELLLSSGIRALDHAAERWCSTAPQAYSDAVSRQAMLILAENLPRVRRNPGDLAARAACQEAAWLSVMGGWSGVPVGASHGLGYILGAARGVPHGITSCLMLHAVMRWNAPVNEHRQRDVAHIFGGEEAGPAIEAFVRSLGLPTRLSEQGIAAEEIPGLAARWKGDAPIATNPRPIRGPADLEAILRLAA